MRLNGCMLQGWLVLCEPTTQCIALQLFNSGVDGQFLLKGAIRKFKKLGIEKKPMSMNGDKNRLTFQPIRRQNHLLLANHKEGPRVKCEKENAFDSQ